MNVIISFAKTHPRTEQQFPLWQITRQEALNKRLKDPNADIHVCINFNFDNIRVFSEAIKRGICSVSVHNHFSTADGKGRQRQWEYLFSAEGKGKRLSNFRNTERQRTFSSLHESVFNWIWRFVALSSDNSVFLICLSVNG